MSTLCRQELLEVNEIFYEFYIRLQQSNLERKYNVKLGYFFTVLRINAKEEQKLNAFVKHLKCIAREYTIIFLNLKNKGFIFKPSLTIKNKQNKDSLILFGPRAEVLKYLEQEDFYESYFEIELLFHRLRSLSETKSTSKRRDEDMDTTDHTNFQTSAAVFKRDTSNSMSTEAFRFLNRSTEIYVANMDVLNLKVDCLVCGLNPCSYPELTLAGELFKKYPKLKEGLKSNKKPYLVELSTERFKYVLIVPFETHNLTSFQDSLKDMKLLLQGENFKSVALPFIGSGKKISYLLS